MLFAREVRVIEVSEEAGRAAVGGVLLQRVGGEFGALTTAARIEGTEGRNREQTPPPTPRRIGAAPRHVRRRVCDFAKFGRA